jgi:hypothetical protein
LRGWSVRKISIRSSPRWESEEAIRAFAGDDISVAKYDDFDKDFLLELEPCSTHYEMYDN